jgi:hypothetical protein
LRAKKPKKEIQEAVEVDLEDDSNEEEEKEKLHKSRSSPAIHEPTDMSPVALQLHWVFNDSTHVWFFLKAWADLDQKCRVEEYGVRVYCSLNKPDDGLLTNDLKLDLHSAHQMIHDLKGE